MKRFHLFFGLTLLIIFILTGLYMDVVHHHLAEMADKPRLLMRSRHIYILLSTFPHLILGGYFQTNTITWRKRLQWLGSSLTTIGSILLVVAFFTEPWRQSWDMPVALVAVIALLTGVMSHVVSGWKEDNGLRARG